MSDSPQKRHLRSRFLIDCTNENSFILIVQIHEVFINTLRMTEVMHLQAEEFQGAISNE